MGKQPRNPEVRINPENFHPWDIVTWVKVSGLFLNSGF